MHPFTQQTNHSRDGKVDTRKRGTDPKSGKTNGSDLGVVTTGRRDGMDAVVLVSGLMNLTKVRF